MKSFLGLLAGGTFLLIAGPALADCANATASAEIKSCLAQDLRDSDARINASYKLLMASRDEAGKTALRNEQRAWLKQRDTMCSLDNKISDREKWLQAIMASDAKTLCVTRYTFARVTALNSQLPKSAEPLPPAPQAPRLDQDPSAAAPKNTVYKDDGYTLTSAASQTKGKWYFELSIDRGQIARLGDVLLESGYQGPQGGIIYSISVRHTDTGKAPVNVGIAIDLDNGAAYTRWNGNWGEQPGSNAGISVKLGLPYSAWLASSSPLGSFVQRGLIKVNLGEHPFVYTLPDGYRPFTQ